MRQKLFIFVLTICMILSLSAFATIASAEDAAAGSSSSSGDNASVSTGAGTVAGGAVSSGSSGGVGVEEGGNVAVGGDSSGSSDSSSVETGSCGDTAIWTLDSDGTLTISGTGAINSWAFSNNTQIAKVIVQEGITAIDYSAFYGCSKLCEVILPESLETIGEQAFCSCENLSELTMGSKVTEIPNNAFAYCGFETFVVPDGVTTLGYAAVSGSKLRVVYVPASVTDINSGAFGYSGVVIVGEEGSAAQDYAENYSYNGISFITEEQSVSTGSAGADITYELDIIKGTLTFSGSGAMNKFYYYDTPWWDYRSGVSKVIVDEDITTIGNYAFYGFGKLTDISLGSNIAKIGEYAFYECTKLESIGVQNQLTEIGSYAFGYCSKLASFPGGNKLVTIGSYAFQSCSGLGDVILSDSLTTVEINAFASADVNNLHIGKNLGADFANRLMPCDVNGTITVSAENPNFVVQNNVLMNPDKTEIIKAGAISGDYIVADTVKKIASRAFYGKSITSVTLPEGLKEIGEQAFNSCNYLSEITVPVSVVKIGSRAFLDRTSFVIKGYTNTITEKYCADGGYTFESLGQATVSQIKVTNSLELTEALQSPVSAQIILADGVYAFEEPVDIDGAYNLTITAENAGKAEILTFDGYQPVLKIENSENVTVTGIILGHFSLVYKSGNCGNGTKSGGYVIYCYDSENITVDGCDLYGCGTYAACLSYTGGFNIKNSVLRDCSEGIIYSYGYSYGADENVIIENCIISGNAYLEEYAAKYAGILNNSKAYTLKNCTFVNNYSTARESDSSSVTYEECVFSDNAWDGYTPQEYGLCLNGITWQIAVNDDGERVLKIGYSLSLNDGTVIESAVGAVLPYSTSSIPWKGKEYNKIELAEGIIYDDNVVHSACGYDMPWTLNKSTGVLDITGTGRMFEYYHWEYLYDYIKTINVSDDITYIYRNALRYTPFFYETGERIDGILYIGKHLVDADVESGTVTIREGTLTIAEYAFSGCGMTKVVIPEGITSIPKGAFEYCSNLTEVVIPDSVTEIGDYAFEMCEALTGITIPQSVTSIGSRAFSGCSKLENIVLPHNLTSLGESAFDDCSSLTSVILPGSLTELPSNLFWGCSSLTGVVIPDSVTKLPYGMFRACTALKEYTIPNSITYVDNSVFEGCSNLEKLTIPASVTYFSYNCLSGCTSLKEIYYDGTRAQWDSMEYNALSDVSSLNQTIYGKDFTLAPLAVEYKLNSYSNTITITGAKSFVTDLVIPGEIDGYPVKSIKNDAFTDNANIKSVTLPDGIEYVTYAAFEGTAFYDNKDNWDNGILYAGKYLLRADPQLTGTVSVKNGTEVVGEFAFEKCNGITEITLPDSATTIMSGAFSNCISLEKATLPNTITALYGELFYNCTALKEVTLPKNLSELDAWLFYGCSSLENVYISDENATYSSVGGILYSKDKTTLVYYPCGKGSTAVVPDGVTTLARNAFFCTAATSLNLPVTVATVENYAFNHCTNLADVSYGGTKAQWQAITIGEYGNEPLLNARVKGTDFELIPDVLKFTAMDDGTAQLTSCVTYADIITIPAEYEGLPVASINMWAFENCNILSSINVAEGNGYFKSVDGVLYSADMTTLIKYPASKTDKSYTVPDSVTEIEYQAFAGCKYLEKLTLSANVSVIENRIFDNCQSLTELVIKEGTTTIGYAVLEGCTNLAKVSIPESVTAIEEYAFNNCTGLKTVEYAGSKSDWEEISIADYNSELTNADVICAKLDPAYEIAVFDGAWFDYEANEFNVNVYVDGVKESFAVLAAIYDEDNRLTAVEKVIVTTDDSGVVNIRIPTEPTYIIPKLKLFFRNDDNLSIPLDKPIVMENIMF